MACAPLWSVIALVICGMYAKTRRLLQSVNATNVISAIVMSLKCATAKAMAMPTIATALAALMTGAIETRLASKPATWMCARVVMIVALDWDEKCTWIDRTAGIV